MGERWIEKTADDNITSNIKRGDDIQLLFFSFSYFSRIGLAAPVLAYSRLISFNSHVPSKSKSMILPLALHNTSVALKPTKLLLFSAVS